MEPHYRQTYTFINNQKNKCIEQLKKEEDINKKDLLSKQIINLDEIFANILYNKIMNIKLLVIIMKAKPNIIHIGNIVI